MNKVSLTNNMDFNEDTFPNSLSLVIDSEKTFGFKTSMKILGFKEKTNLCLKLMTLTYLTKLQLKQF